MKTVSVTIYGGFPSCEDTECTLRKECTNHTSAGDYRSEFGVRPVLSELLLDEQNYGTMECDTFSAAIVDNQGNYVSCTAPINKGEMVLVSEISSRKKSKKDTSIHEDFKNLESACFAIESKLPMFTLYTADSDASYIRRELYNLRIVMGNLQRFASTKGVEYV